MPTFRYWQMLVCIGAITFLLYRYIAEHNEVLALRRQIPRMITEVRELQEDNISLEYTLEAWRSPKNLLKLSQQPEFGHLKPVSRNEVMVIEMER